MSEGEGDISVMLSSELISKIVQEYFNKVMFKQKVRIVDLRPASDGYMFVVEFTSEKKDDLNITPKTDFVENVVTNSTVAVRDNKGQFAKVKGE